MNNGNKLCYVSKAIYYFIPYNTSKSEKEGNYLFYMDCCFNNELVYELVLMRLSSYFISINGVDVNKDHSPIIDGVDLI